METNCLNCAKWVDGKGFEVLYQGGIKPAMNERESIIRFSNDKALVWQICQIIDVLQDMDETVVRFQGELGLLGKNAA